MIKKIENSNGKKNNSMDISSDKPARLHMRRPGYGKAKETLREKLNMSIATESNYIRTN